MKRIIIITMLLFLAFSSFAMAENVKISVEGESEITVRISADFEYSSVSVWSEKTGLAVHCVCHLCGLCLLDLCMADYGCAAH